MSASYENFQDAIPQVMIAQVTPQRSHVRPAIQLARTPTTTDVEAAPPKPCVLVQLTVDKPRGCQDWQAHNEPHRVPLVIRGAIDAVTHFKRLHHRIALDLRVVGQTSNFPSRGHRRYRLVVTSQLFALATLATVINTGTTIVAFLTYSCDAEPRYAGSAPEARRDFRQRAAQGLGGRRILSSSRAAQPFDCNARILWSSSSIWNGLRNTGLPLKPSGTPSAPYPLA